MRDAPADSMSLQNWMNQGRSKVLVPILVLTETGRLVPFTVASMIFIARAGFFNRALPWSLETTFLAGQPMFRSIASTPRASTFFAASVKFSGFLPKIWAISGFSTSGLKSNCLKVFLLLWTIPSVLVNSVKQITRGSISLTNWRKALSV